MSIQKLTLQEWFLAYQLAHISRHHFHLDAFLEADISSLCQAYGEKPIPMTYILIKALALTQKHVPACNRQYTRSIWGPRMLVSNRCCINVPVMLQIEGENYLSVTTVKDADCKSISEIQAEIRAYRQTPKTKLPIGKHIIGKPNTWLNRQKLSLIHTLVNAWPQLQDQRDIGLASVSSLLNLEHNGTQLMIAGRGPGAMSLTACHVDADRQSLKLSLAFDHFALSGVVMAQAGITLCRILQRELEEDALLA